MVTIKDVAAAAGVVPSTVSYVLSGSRKVSEPTRIAVRAAIDELGYHPNAGARSLRSTRTNVIALALPLASPGYLPVGGRFMYGLSRAAGELGYDLLVLTVRGDDAGTLGLERTARSRLADVALVMGVEMRDPRISAMDALGFPVVVLGRPDDEDSAPWADLDWEEAAVASLRLLRETGHRNLCFLSTVEEDIASGRSYSVRGLRGAERAATELGVAVRTLPSTKDPAELHRRLDALFEGDDAPTALAVQHPAAVPGILRHLAKRGIDVPGDVSLVAIGSFPEDLGGLDVTRIELPVERMSSAVTRLAVAAASGEPTDSSQRHELIPPEITSGGTVAPPA
ncbi:LacI family DNA-binding transcriptional regulator [Nocardiopsis sp. L17-MgMaSL7]|uniref:LacI family DNA-binding transcriptional regulator n=1 Tax=Nocardiopsis sp. L17-MgMaSL7 TaxID=1938893 RepID=UPI000D714202|nr:LacI family DNA-binding transcriptional regulator [Nocardiopsis sp. L17-MgMaSL7]PWV55174.1 LacI family transcriptional regulator [Nocardiopsis sp. L17-MgMaSL7]